MKIAKYLLVTFTLLLLSYDAAFACRCPRRKPSPDLSQFEAVFVGKVVDEGDFRSSPRKVKFRVERFWKGELTGELVMFELIQRLAPYVVLADEGGQHRQVR